MKKLGSFDQKSDKCGKNKSPTVVHERIICDGCEANPIEGVRYKCAICPNFDLCSKCEETTTHEHPFLKLKTPQNVQVDHQFEDDNGVPTSEYTEGKNPNQYPDHHVRWKKHGHGGRHHHGRHHGHGHGRGGHGPWGRPQGPCAGFGG